MIPLICFRGQRDNPYEDNELRNLVMAKFERFGITMLREDDDMTVWFVAFTQVGCELFVKMLDLMDVKYRDCSDKS